MIENSEQFGFHTTGAVKIESLYAVALYDPINGSIRHMHHVVSMTGSLRNKPDEIEKVAISNAKRFGHNVDNLKVLHIENFDPSSQYRVDIKSEKLVKLQNISFSDLLRERSNKTNKIE